MDEISKGNEAQRLLDSPLFKEIWPALKAEVIEQWSATPARDVEGREWVWRHYKVIEKVEHMILGYVETGKLERIKIEEKEKFADRIKRRFS